MNRSKSTEPPKLSETNTKKNIEVKVVEEKPEVPTVKPSNSDIKVTQDSKLRSSQSNDTTKNASVISKPSEYSNLHVLRSVDNLNSGQVKIHMNWDDSESSDLSDTK